MYGNGLDVVHFQGIEPDHRVRTLPFPLKPTYAALSVEALIGMYRPSR